MHGSWQQPFLAIAEFEKSHVLNKFSSRFDNFLAEQGGDVSGFGVEKVTLPSGEIFRKYVGPPKKFRSRYFSYRDADCTEKIAAYPSEVGKFKVSSLRNIARTAPYGHNGFFATLGDIVNFYNRRDALADAYPDMFAPEVAETVNDGELGNLGLTSRQERRVVLFLRTLTDR
jgi:cytochrome c peroxidase